MSLSQNYPTTRPTLTLDFAKAKRVDPRVTFTRASTATYFDASGTLRSAAANAPRIDFDPATLACRGLLVEEQRTNTAYPSIIPASTTGTMLIGNGIASTVPNAAVAPDGTTTATSYTSVQGNSNSSAGSSIRHLNGVTVAGTYTVSFFAKANTGGFSVVVRFVDAGASLDTSVTCSATDGGNNTITTQWRRYYATITLGAGSTGFYSIFNFAGNSDTTYVWGAQLEAGSFPTSYIPTTTTSLTRSADVASVTTLSPWYNSVEGSIYAEVQPIALSAVVNQNALQFSDGTTNNRIALYRQSIAVSTALSFGTTITGSAWTTTAIRKFALGNKSGDSVLVDNGSVSNTAAGTTVQTVNQLRLGSNHDGTGGYLNGHLQRIAYYNTRLPNAQLQALTAP